jgi:hypothetical protein
MIISPHIPKTGGSTFQQLLLNEFKDKYCADYEELPLAYRFYGQEVPNKMPACFDSKNISIVQGHFLARKYLGIDGDFITWLRHPVERVVSHYYYWQRKADIKHVVYRYMLENNLTLDSFSKLECLKDFQSYFLSGVDIESFSYVGITEQYDRSLRLFCEMYQIDISNIPRQAMHANPERPLATNYDIPMKLRRELESLHKVDVSLYERGLSRFELLCEKYGI